MSTIDLRRREFLLGAAAASAASLSGCSSSLAANVFPRAQGEMRTDVAIVGAGLAGLASARHLAAAGLDCMVLEARDRVGGRILNAALPSGAPIETGGQWVGPTQDRILALAQDLGVETFLSYDSGMYVDYRNGQRHTYAGRIPTSDPAGAVEAGATIERLNFMAAEVPPEAPYAAPQAEAWDSQTFQSWMDANLATPGGKSLVTLAIEAVFSVQPRDLSLLHVLFYIRSAGDLNLLINTTGGAQERRFIGGSQLVAQRAANALGARVHQQSAVRRIIQDRHGLRLEGDGFAVRAQHCIVAVPPTLAARIDYQPALPALRDQMTQRMPMGTVIKVQCVYATPFWREDGLAGQATSDTGPVKIAFDNSPPDGHLGVLLGFMEGSDGREWSGRSADERRTAVIECFVRYFGAQAAQPLAYIEQDWNQEPWSRGGYGGSFPPGAWLDYGRALRAPVGRIHWAGTETASIWNGYMDGAVRSGERAAAEVLQG